MTGLFHSLRQCLSLSHIRCKHSRKKEGLRRRRNWSTEFVTTHFWSTLCVIAGNGYSLKRFPLLPLLFWIRFLTAFKREKKNHGVSPPWLAGNNPLLLFCASFFSKASEFSFLKLFNSIFEDALERAATASLSVTRGRALPARGRFLLTSYLVLWTEFGKHTRVLGRRESSEELWGLQKEEEWGNFPQ